MNRPLSGRPLLCLKLTSTKTLLTKKSNKKMRRIIACCILCCAFYFADAQRNETLFNNARLVGAFGGPMLEFTQLDGEYTTFSGGGGGLVIGNFFVGGYGLGTTDYRRWIDGNDFRIDMGHGGFWLGYFAPKHKLIHPYGSLKIGWGATDIDDGGFDEAIFVLTPELGIELNVTSWFRIAGTVNYRWVDGIDSSPSFDAGDFSAVGAGLTFRFGWFGRSRNWDYED